MNGLPSFDGNTSMEETLQMIDKSIEKQQKAIDELMRPLLALKSRRNGLVPVSGLPPEIICEIFELAQLPDPDLEHMDDKPDPLEWVNLTYVCRHWRNIALNSASLWVAPPVGNPKWAEEMVRRSNGYSLVIKVDGGHGGIGSRFDFVLDHIHRIRELSMRDIDPSTWDLLQERLPKDAPRLQSFRLAGRHVPQLEPDDYDIPVNGGEQSEPLIILEDLLCDTECLRELELVDCRLNWTSQTRLLSSLTHLKLRDLSPDFGISRQEFLDALKRMPKLEVLELVNSIPTALNHLEEQFSLESDHIHLSHLRTLHIEDCIIPDIYLFFSCVTFPPTATVQVVCKRNRYGDYPDFYNDFSGLARSYSDATCEMAFQSLVLSRPNWEDEGSVRLQLFTEAFKTVTEMLRYDYAAPRLELVIYQADPPTFETFMVNIFNCGLPLHNLDRVYHNVPGFETEMIASTLGKLPQLRYVVVGEDAGKSFFDAMHLGSCIGDTAGSGEAPVQMLNFPCVSAIFFYGMSFCQRNVNESRELSHKLLQDILIQRCELGVPIERLILSGCYGVAEEDIKLLEEIVVDIRWDGH